MPFSKLIGNEPAKNALQRMAQDRAVPSTLLFYGPDGVGKGKFALAFSQLLMGSTKTHPPDLHQYYPEGKSAIHTMESMRGLIDEVALPPFEAPVKVFILHDAHQMLPYSSNSLLKTLEEPSPHSYFILLTSSLDAMLPTIVSRCRKIPFFPIPQSAIETLIRDQWQKSPEEARRIAFLSHGSLSKAEALTQHHQLPWRKTLLEILSLQMPDDYPQFHRLAAELDTHDEEEETSSHTQHEAIFEEIVAWYRDLQLLKEGIAPEYLYHLDCIDRLKMAVQQPFPPMEKVLEKTVKARLALQRNVRLKTVLENFFLGV